MNILLQRPFQNLYCSFSLNSHKLIAFVRTKKTDTRNEPSAATASSAAGTAQQQSKIMLVQPNQAITVTTLKEAQKLAKRRELHLVKQQDFDMKMRKPVYKLVTTAEMLSEEMDESIDNKKKRTERKSEKSLTISSRIAEHDLASRLKHISKWLAKNHEICVFIQGSHEDMANCEKIVKAIEQSLDQPEVIGRIVQKRAKGSNIKFNILPVAKTAEQQA